MTLKSFDIASNLIYDLKFYEDFKIEGFETEILFHADTGVISDLHINHLSTFSNKFKILNFQNPLIKGKIKFIFSNDVANFDIAIIGLIALFKENFKNVSFEITFPKKSDVEVFSRFRDVFISLRSWYEALTGIALFIITDEYLFDKELIKEPGDVMPIILITPKTFHDLFVKNSPNFDLVELLRDTDLNEVTSSLQINLSLSYAKSITYASKNYQAVRDTIAEIDINWQNSNRVFYNHYLKMLAEFDLLPEYVSYLKDEQGKSIRLTSSKKRDLKDFEMNKLKKEIREIIIKLKSQPPLLTLFFSILVTKNLEKIIDNFNDYILRLNELFIFSRNLFLGIRELARNIIEHTESKIGIITGRIYNGEVLNQLKGFDRENIGHEVIDNYYEFLNSKGYLNKDIKNEYFFDLVIFDEGQKGIINKTIENIEFLIGDSGEEENIYHSDIDSLKTGKIVFTDFYNPSDIKLNHQVIKASSHWGLVIFTNLINKNNGLLYASSFSQNSLSPFDSCYKYDEIIKSPARRNDFFEVGSFYNIILPLDKKFNLKDEYIANTVPKEPNFSEKNFITLLKYNYEKQIDNIKGDGEHTLLQIRVFDFLPKDLTNEYRIENATAINVSKYFRQIKPNQKKFIPVIDFDLCESVFDQSKLIRFLAELQKRTDIYSIIISNIEQDTIKDLFRTLTLGFTSSNNKEALLNKHFWNRQHFILIYSYDVNKKGTRIYFTDILGGYTYGDFYLLNKKIESTHFTYPKFFDKINPTLTDETTEGLINCPLYITQSGVVQNYEMIIEHDNKTLFEHSIEFILNEEIKY